KGMSSELRPRPGAWKVVVVACGQTAAAALTSTQSYRHYIDTDRCPEQQSTQSVAQVPPQ
ncbi:MAG: hypothetical protein WBW31_21850, partial [Candidatus Sulfotelmatobacter sp.]